ncbi:3-phytase A [Thermothelomyces heterothallicus CBS 202.75]|uniref:3-phytase A n=1 Tax=Thermothelomyces heterothallicus CBS 202.75 TaxID=1149848 RepID=UPI00374246E6
MTGLGVMVVMVGFLAIASLQSESRPCDTPELGFQCGTAISHFWGQYSPYFSVPSELDASIPDDCEVTFAQVLSRHGARAPTLKRAASYVDLIDRIHHGAVSYGPGYEFLRTYDYTLGADELTRTGQQQMVNSGIKFYRRYRALARKSVPFVRTAGQDRVVHSAQNFTQGFHSALLADRGSTVRPTLPYDMVVIPETAGANNTLHNDLCTAFEEGPYSTIGDDAQDTYLSTFAGPITARVNANLPGANLTDADTVALMDLCPFETVASSSSDRAATADSGGNGRPLSPFCRLFSESEWRAYDYLQSVGKWYGYGPGNPLGPTQGVGFVNELLARLAGVPVRDGTSTNRTLDGDPRTFPLGRPLYADFSHDNDMMGVLGALGAYDGVPPLDKTARRDPEELGGYAASWAVPFAARIYVEKMRCGGGGGGGGSGGSGGGGEGRQEKDEEMVRVLVNDRVMGLKGCGADERGMCTLERFIESMVFARGNGKWDLCFA